MCIRDRETIDQEWWNRRIAVAHDVRRTLGLTDNPDTNCYRLVHGEGDALPGLVVDLSLIHIYPVSGYARYAALPKADVILITHSHYDHLDVAAVEAIQTPQTEILCDRTSAEAFEMNCYTCLLYTSGL